jgi:hypothetical protein
MSSACWRIQKYGLQSLALVRERQARRPLLDGREANRGSCSMLGATLKRWYGGECAVVVRFWPTSPGTATLGEGAKVRASSELSNSWKRHFGVVRVAYGPPGAWSQHPPERRRLRSGPRRTLAAMAAASSTSNNRSPNWWPSSGLGHLSTDAAVNIEEETVRLRSKSQQLTRSIFANLSPWQITQLARHPQRPYALDYIAAFCTEFQELHGDRMYADDLAIIGGLARLEGRPVMIVGHQKGRDTKERVRRNYGMPKPEGYRKALRLMKMGEKFGLPIITFIDTPGAYPGVGSEERNQSEAIARNLFEMSVLSVPIITVVTGEGGSGGALGIGVCDRLLMLQYLDLLGHLAGGLRLDPVEERRQERVAAEALKLRRAAR